MPKGTDMVITNYRGTFIDGTEFDSSVKHGGPATFPVNGVIPGLDRSTAIDARRDKWQLVVPSNLAYGEHGAPPDIGPNATLVFDIELLEVAPGSTAPAGNPGAATISETGPFCSGPRGQGRGVIRLTAAQTRTRVRAYPFIVRFLNRRS